MKPNPIKQRIALIPVQARQFFTVLLVTIGLTCLASQFTARWLGFRTASMLPFDYGSPDAPTRAFVGSSSLGFYGLDWDNIAAQQGWRIRRYDIPAASPCEFEPTQDLVTNATKSLIVISIFDMDETYFSEHRAALVPVSRTIRDLNGSRMEWSFWKRTLCHYPEHCVSYIFPTACSATGVMVGWREKFRALFSHNQGPDTESDKAVLNGQTNSFPTGRVSEWDQGRLLRNLAGIMANAEHAHFFGGPKQEALERILTKGLDRGDVFVVVMPVTPEYRRQVISESLQTEFAARLTALRQQYPRVKFIRLDRFTPLDDSKYFWDLVHLNAYGRQIATQELERELQESAHTE